MGAAEEPDNSRSSITDQEAGDGSGGGGGGDGGGGDGDGDGGGGGGDGDGDGGSGGGGGGKDVNPDADIPGPAVGKYNVYMTDEFKKKGAANSKRIAEQVVKKSKNSGVLYYHGFKVRGGGVWWEWPF